MRTRAIRPVREYDVDVVHLETLERLAGAFDDTGHDMNWRSCIKRQNGTDCFLESPFWFGPGRVPQ